MAFFLSDICGLFAYLKIPDKKQFVIYGEAAKVSPSRATCDPWVGQTWFKDILKFLMKCVKKLKFF